MKRTFRVVVALVLAGSIVAMPEAAAAETTCGSWHNITHGETGLNVRPDPIMYQGNTQLFADAIPGTDYWNQQFRFCRDPRWNPDHFAIYSNLTRMYWTVSGGGNGGYAYAGWQSIDGVEQLFEVRRYDSTWWTIRWVGSVLVCSFTYPKVSPDRSQGENNALRTSCGPLNGNSLFRITPPNLMG